MNKQICQISFNTNNTGDNDRWKLLYNGQETFHSDIIVNVQTYTSDNYSEETKDNWNITFTGYLTMTDDIVYIKDKLEEENRSGFVDNFNPKEHLKKLSEYGC